MRSFLPLLALSLAVPASAAPQWSPWNGATIPPGSAVLVGPERNLLGGWNHLPGEAVATAHGNDAPAYDPGAMDWEGTPSHLSVTLVRKLGDWDHQHANGLEGLWSGVVFDRVVSLVVDFRVAGERLPNAASIAAAYATWLTPDQLAALDASRPALRFTLTGPSGVWSAERFIDITPARAGWMRLEIPLEDFVLFRGVPWDKKRLTAAELAEARVGGLRIEPEALGGDPARAGSTARNFAPAAWESGTPPELLKEVDLEWLAVFLRLR